MVVLSAGTQTCWLRTICKIWKKNSYIWLIDCLIKRTCSIRVLFENLDGFTYEKWNGTIRGHSFAIDINLQDLSIKNGHWLIRFKFKFPILCHFSRLATTGKLIDGDDDDDNYFDDDWTWNSDRKPGLLGLVSTSSRHILVTFFSIQVQWTCCFSQI